MTKLNGFSFFGVPFFTAEITRSVWCRITVIVVFYGFVATNRSTVLADQIAVPLSLDQAIALALRKNPALAQPQAILNSSNSSVDFALEEFSIQYAPVASVQADENRTTGSIGLTAQKLLSNGARLAFDVVDRQWVESGDRSGTIKVEVVQPLLRRYGKIVTEDNLYRARNVQGIAQLQLQIARIETASSTIDLYLAIRRQKLLINEAQRDIKRSQAFLRTITARESVGRAVQADRLQIELKLSQATLRYETLLSDLGILEDDFGDLLDLDEAFQYELVETPTIESDTMPSVNQSVKWALDNRPDHALIEREVERARRIYQLSERGNLPDLELTARYERSLYGDGFEDDDDQGRYFIGISTKSELGGLQEKRQTELSRSLLAQKLIELRLYRRALRREVSRTVANLTSAGNELRQAENIVNFARQQLTANEKLFKVGRTDSFRVADSQEAFTQAQGNRILAESNLASARYDYERVVGRLIQDPHHRLSGGQ